MRDPCTTPHSCTDCPPLLHAAGEQDDLLMETLLDARADAGDTGMTNVAYLSVDFPPKPIQESPNWVIQNLRT